MLTWAEGSDNVVQLSGLADTVTGDPIVDAVVAVTIYDGAGAEVSGAAWPVAMPYVLADGVYRVTLPYTVGVVGPATYTQRIVATTITGNRAEFTCTLIPSLLCC